MYIRQPFFFSPILTVLIRLYANLILLDYWIIMYITTRAANTNRLCAILFVHIFFYVAVEFYILMTLSYKFRRWHLKLRVRNTRQKCQKFVQRTNFHKNNVVKKICRPLTLTVDKKKAILWVKTYI